MFLKLYSYIANITINILSKYIKFSLFNKYIMTYKTINKIFKFN